MKRALVLVTLVTAFAGLTFACSEDAPSQLKGGDDSSKLSGDSTNDPSTPATTPPAATTQKTTSASTVKPADAGAPSSTNPLAACDPAKTTTQADCAKCCATKSTVVKDVDSCACGAGSACGSACAASFCSATGDGIPDIGCGLCLVQANCDFSNVGTTTSDADTCLQTCEDKN